MLNFSATNSPDRLTPVYLDESQLDALADCLGDLIELARQARQKRAAESASLDSSTDSTADGTTLAEPAQLVKSTTPRRRGQVEATQ